MLKYLWTHHRAFCLLVTAYLIPAQVTFYLTFDSQLAVCIGGLAIVLAAPFIWKYA